MYQQIGVSHTTVKGCWSFIEPTGSRTLLHKIQEVGNMPRLFHAHLSSPLNHLCKSHRIQTPHPTPIPATSKYRHPHTHTHAWAHAHVLPHSRWEHLPSSAAARETAHCTCFSLSRPIASNYPNSDENSNVIYSLHLCFCLDPFIKN